MKNSQHIYYEKGYSYRVSRKPFYRYFPALKHYRVEEKYFTLIDGWLRLALGYAWDGASGAIDTENFMRASAVHDAGCQMTDRGLLHYNYRIMFDEELRKMCIEDGMSKIRAWWVYRAVRRYSTSFNPKGDKRKIYISPN